MYEITKIKQNIDGFRKEMEDIQEMRMNTYWNMKVNIFHTFLRDLNI